MQAAGGIHQQDVGGARLRRGSRVEERGGRIASLFGLDQRDAGALSPDLELLDRSGAEGIRRAQQYRSALAPEERRELATGSRLAGAVDTDQKDDLWWCRSVANGRVHRVEDAANLVLERYLQLCTVRKPMTQRAVAQARDDLIGGWRTDVGGEQSKLQLIERGLINLAGERDDA